VGTILSVSRIKVLSEQLANRIAAGEVVERPASVVKELVENAIDADASRIDIVVEAGGKDLISVSDNGIGMSSADLELALRRHATSKISNTDDLYHIDTLGFRGEALPAIASVSRMEIISREAGSDLASNTIVNQGKFEESGTTGAPYGTTVIVRELFFSTPARRKYLKTASTEFGHVAEVVERIVAACPRIAFSLKHADKSHLDLPATGTYFERITDLWGEEKVKEFLEIEAGGNGIALFGFIAPPTIHKANSRNIWFVLNGRPVKNAGLFAAVKRAYEGTLPSGRYPQAIIYLEVDPELVDVNVHPMKLEVRFRRSDEVFRAIVHGIRGALATDQVPADLEPTPRKSESESFAFRNDSADQNTIDFDSARRPGYARKSEISQQTISEREIYSTPTFSEFHSDSIEIIIPTFWQIHDSYIIAETKGGLLVIDQHAAHERILYEEIRNRIERGKISGQRLLFPIATRLTALQESTFRDNRSLLEKLGFEFGPMAPGHLLVEAVPQEMKDFGKGYALVEILDDLEEGKSAMTALDEFSALAACRMAIKAGDPLSPEEMGFLFDRLFATESPYTCPHGRPTIIKIGLDELEKRFKRK